MKIFLVFCLLLIASPIYAGKFWPVPECPYTGHATCSDHKDNDVDGTKDEAAPSAAFSAVTSGYAADIAECQLLTYASTADAESDSGNMAEKSGTYRQGQVACAGNFTADTYFVWLRLRTANGTDEDKRVVWVNTSPFTSSFQNSNAALPFTATNGISSVMAWSKIGEGLTFSEISTSNIVDPHTTGHKSIALSGDAAIYITADGAVKLDCIFIGTNSDAAPSCPSGSQVPGTAPQAGAITVSGVTTTTFTASWDYDTESTDDGDCYLNYGTTSGNLTSQSATATSTSGTCSRQITGLTAGTIYYMRGTSQDVDGATETPETNVQTSVQTTGPIRYAVASGGSTSATCLSAGTPCTLSRALNQAVAGDTVQLADGTYTTVPITVRSGTASQPITIKAENRHQAIIQPAIGSNGQCMDIRHSYITVKWLVISGNNNQNCFDGLRALGTKGPPEVFLLGVVIEDNQIINVGGKAVFLGAVDGLIFRWNYINTTGVTFYNSSAGVYMGSYDGTSQVKNSQIYANEIYDTMTECFDVKVASNNNDIHHNICQYSGRNSDNGVQPISPFDNANTGAITFDGTSLARDNIFRSYEARGTWAGCASVFNSSGTALFRNNVCRDSTSGVALGGNSSGVATATSNTFCTLVSYGTAGGGSTWTLNSNNGVPGSGAVASACDAEEARILSERAALPGNPSSATSSNDPIAYFAFDENTGTDAADSSTGGQIGTLTNGATWGTGKNGSGVSLDGVNDYVRVTTLNWSPTTGTITLWYKPSSFPDTNTHYIFGHTLTPCCASRIQFYFDDTGGNLDMGLGDSHTRALAQQDMATGTWYHLGLTWDNGTYVVYVNGAQVSTGSYTGLASIAGYAHVGGVGDDNVAGTVTWALGAAGIIDEFKVWNIALNSTQITTEYNIFGP